MPIENKKFLTKGLFKNLEYCSILRNKKAVLEIDGNELEGKTWREFQLYLGEKLSPGICYYTMKNKNSNEIHTGRIRAATMEFKPIQESNQMESEIIKELKSLKDNLSKAEKTGGISYEMLLASTKAGHEAQINYLTEKLKDKDDKISELKNEVDDLADDLDDCQKESAKNTGLGNYLAIGEKILNMKFGKQTAISLKDSNASDIPDEILTVLGVIDWMKIDQQSIEKIANNIQQYLSLIPKEYFKGV
jgi:hypothetical protein